MPRPVAYLVVFVSSCCTLILELVAGRILGILATHLPGPHAVAARVRLLARQDLRDSALAAMRELIRLADAEGAPLNTAAPILNSAVEQGKLKIVGGIYRLTTGTVDLIAQG